MKIFWTLLMMLLLNPAFTQCDRSVFRWGCDINIQQQPTNGARSLIYCGHAYGYVSAADYKILQNYQRLNIDFVLKLNGEFIEGPCYPGHAALP